MPKKLRSREVSEKERREIVRLVRSRTAPVRLMQRARVTQEMLVDPNLSAARAGRLAAYDGDFSRRLWATRFNRQGLAGL